MTRRNLGGLLLVASLLVATAAPALAKMPPYEAAVMVDGDVATVTVVFDGYDMGVPILEGTLGLVAQEPPSDSFVWIDLLRTEAFTYEGSVVIPYPGEWAIVPFPDASPPPPSELYPTTTFTASFAVADSAESTAGTPGLKGTEVEVAARKAVDADPFERSPILARTRADRSQTAWIGAGLGAALLAGAWALRRRSPAL